MEHLLDQGATFGDLNELYTLALGEAFNTRQGRNLRRLSNTILGIIVASLDPLSDSALAHFASKDVALIRRTLDYLDPLLLRTDDSVRLLHASLPITLWLRKQSATRPSAYHSSWTFANTTYFCSAAASIRYFTAVTRRPEIDFYTSISAGSKTRTKASRTFRISIHERRWYPTTCGIVASVGETILAGQHRFVKRMFLTRVTPTSETSSSIFYPKYSCGGSKL